MIIDSHCHLHEPTFTDLRGTLTRAIDHDVWGIIAVGSDPTTNARTLEVAGHHGKAIWPCLGCHPEWTRLTDAAVDEGRLPRSAALGRKPLPNFAWARNTRDASNS